MLFTWGSGKPMGQPKWTANLHATLPADEAAAVVVRATLASVARRLRKAAEGEGQRDPERVHQMRVATRRAESAIALFEPMLNADALPKVRGRLKRIRRAGAAARDGDVHLAELNRWFGVALDQHRPALEYLRSRAERERREAQDEIVQAAERFDRRRMKRSARALLRGTEPSGQTLLDAIRARLDKSADEFQAASAGDLNRLDEVHKLRLSVKQVRYLLEMAAQCLHSGTQAEAYQRVERLQEQLGRVNDQHQAVVRLERVMADLSDAERRGERRPSRPVVQGIGEILDLCRARCDKAHRRFLEFWRQTASEGLTADLRGLLAPPAPSWMKPLHEPTNELETALGGEIEPEPIAGSGNGGTRLAAIDVGTNSIRLIVAESSPDGDGGGYRVLDDEKEIARLGRGLEESGRLSQEAMEHSATTIARMREIAEGYGVRMVRAVGTCAVREARNRDEFVELVRRRSGLELEVISAEEEAKLAFLSASTALDLRHVPAAVMDIGGGSTEIVISAAGAIERVYTIPLGAVRLTERFGGAEVAAGERYKEMRELVKSELKGHVGRPPLLPRVLVGTGGTVTALAAMAAHQELGPAARGLFAGSVQGREVRRWEVKHLLENLRKMPVKDRAKVGGLAADRADIIVAGLVLVDSTMKRLGVDTVVAHEGGIRDGLLLTMLREWRGQSGGSGPGDSIGEGGAGGRDPMRSVRRFAKACGYEHRHCGHVARLSLQLFDQLAADPATADPELFTPANRALLEAAALIHDVGYLINYASHHRHSYHLIVHSDLPGWSAREIEIIANVARYHRRAEPKSSHRNLQRLGKPDRRLVKRLSAILRVADGLDRTHTQRVQSVRLQVEPVAPDTGLRGAAVLTVEADEEPTVDMWGASRKAGLFQRVFELEPRLAWQQPERPCAGHEPIELPAPKPGSVPEVVVVRGNGNGVRP